MESRKCYWWSYIKSRTRAADTDVKFFFYILTFQGIKYMDNHSMHFSKWKKPIWKCHKKSDFFTWHCGAGKCSYVLHCVWGFGTQWTVPTRFLCLWDFPGKDTGVCGHFFFQGILQGILTQGLNPHHPGHQHWQLDSLPGSHLRIQSEM